jgi:uncharacterized membrane protein
VEAEFRSRSKIEVETRARLEDSLGVLADQEHAARVRAESQAAQLAEEMERLQRELDAHKAAEAAAAEAAAAKSASAEAEAARQAADQAATDKAAELARLAETQAAAEAAAAAHKRDLAAERERLEREFHERVVMETQVDSRGLSP